jgi:tyrosinase
MSNLNILAVLIYYALGTRPYWNWSMTAVTGLAKSPISDDSDTSMSGNGVYIPSNELGRLNLGSF